MIVINCKSQPQLYRLQNLVKALKFQLKTKEVQYFLPLNKWKSKIIV